MARAWSRSSPAAARPGPRPARALRGTGALCDNSARGFAWRESWKRRVSRDRPAGPPRRVAVRPGPGRRGPASRARCALGVQPPATAGRPGSGRRGRRGHGLLPSPLARCGNSADAVRGPLRRPTLRVHRLRSGLMGSAWRAGVVNQSSASGCAGRRGCSQRPAAVGWLCTPGPPSRRPPQGGPLRPGCAWSQGSRVAVVAVSVVQQAACVAHAARVPSWPVCWHHPAIGLVMTLAVLTQAGVILCGPVVMAIHRHLTLGVSPAGPGFRAAHRAACGVSPLTGFNP